MGMLDFVKGSNAGEYKKEATFGLTPLGKERLKRLSGSEKEFAIMAAIAQHAPATVEEISEHSGLGQSKVKHVIEELIGNEFAARLGARSEV